MPKLPLGLLICSIAAYLAIAFSTIAGISSTRSGLKTVLGGLDAAVGNLQGIQSTAEDNALLLLRLGTFCANSARQIRSQNTSAAAEAVARKFDTASAAAVASRNSISTAVHTLHDMITGVRTAMNRFRGPALGASKWASYLHTALLCVCVLLLGLSLLPVQQCVGCYKVAATLNVSTLSVLWALTGIAFSVGMGSADFCSDVQHGILGSTNSTLGGPQGATFTSLTYFVQCLDGRFPADIRPSLWAAPGLYGDVGEYFYGVQSVTERVQDAVNSTRKISLSVDSLDSLLDHSMEIAAGAETVSAASNCKQIQPQLVKPVQEGFCGTILSNGIAPIWAMQTALCIIAVFMLVMAIPFCHGVRHPGGKAARQYVNSLAAAKAPYTGVSPHPSKGFAMNRQMHVGAAATMFSTKGRTAGTPTTCASTTIELSRVQAVEVSRTSPLAVSAMYKSSSIGSKRHTGRGGRRNAPKKAVVNKSAKVNTNPALNLCEKLAAEPPT